METSFHMQSVTFVSQLEAETMEPRGDTAMLSVTDPGEPAVLQTGWAALLRVEFIDAYYTQEEVDRAGKYFRRCFVGYMMQEHTDKIRNFLQRVAQDRKICRLVVHCLHGRRRSTAVALYAADYYNFHLEKEVTQLNRFVYYMLKDKKAPAGDEWQFAPLSRPALELVVHG